MSFDWHSRTHVVVGCGSVTRVGEFVRGRALLVSDPGLKAAGHLERVHRRLPDAVVFDQVRENPTTRDVEACVAVARGAGIETIVALGGGSSIDTAKGCNFLLTNGGRMHDYRGWHKARQPLLPLVAIPTTAGTGSECQSYALIADEVTHEKMACGDPRALPAVAILDAELTLTQPREVTAASGLDALAHAVESFVTRRRNELSLMFSREAFRLISESLPVVLRQPGNLDARAAVQLGAALAGVAVENSMLGAAHSAANPLTARFGLTHGVAVAVMLPHVVRFNGVELYRPLHEDLPALLEELLAIAGIAPRLRDHGVTNAPSLAGEAARQWTAQFNPRPPDFVAIYEAAQ